MFMASHMVIACMVMLMGGWLDTCMLVTSLPLLCQDHFHTRRHFIKDHLFPPSFLDSRNNWERFVGESFQRGWVSYSAGPTCHHTSKKRKNWRSVSVSPEKLAEKVPKSRRQDFATKVR